LCAATSYVGAPKKNSSRIASALCDFSTNITARRIAILLEILKENPHVIRYLLVGDTDFKEGTGRTVLVRGEKHRVLREACMSKTGDQTSKITVVTAKVVSLLSSLDSEGRQRVIRASMMLLGESTPSLESAGKRPVEGVTEDEQNVLSGLSSKAKAWIKQNGVTIEQLEQVFDLTADPVIVIAGTVPGKSVKDQTIAAYLLKGTAQLLATGEPTFDDKSARKLCDDLGCYDNTNHTGYLKSIGNSITGSKDKGWKLTSPGMKKAADLIKEMTKES
jgi:hypothetical protein